MKSRLMIVWMAFSLMLTGMIGCEYEEDTPWDEEFGELERRLSPSDSTNRWKLVSANRGGEDISVFDMALPEMVFYPDYNGLYVIESGEYEMWWSLSDNVMRAQVEELGLNKVANFSLTEGNSFFALIYPEFSSVLTENWVRIADLEFATVTGKVVDVQDGMPMAGVEVRSDDAYKTITGDNGEFAFEVSSGNRTITINEAGYSETPKILEVEAHNSYNINLRAAATDIELPVLEHDFGDVPKDSTHTWYLLIENTGGADLVINNVTTNHPKFITNFTSEFRISAFQQDSIGISFTPDQIGITLNKIVQIYCNDPDEPNISISVSGTGALPPGHFEPVEETGLPYAVIIRDARLNGTTIADGDEIGIFDEEGQLCVGSATVVGGFAEQLSITAWQGDNSNNLPGFTPGNTMYFKIYVQATGEEIDATPTMIMGDGTFGYTPLSNLELDATAK